MLILEPGYYRKVDNPKDYSSVGKVGIILSIDFSYLPSKRSSRLSRFRMIAREKTNKLMIPIPSP